MNNTKKNLFAFTTVCILIIASGGVEAGTTTGMPWEGPLDSLMNSITGPVARIAGALAIFFFGIGLAFSEGGGIIRKGLWIVLGLSIAFNAVSWGLAFFGFTGGLLI